MTLTCLKAGLAVVLLSLGVVAPAAAGKFEDAWAAYQRGDFATALRLWSPLAEQGEPYAQYYLGLMYSLGYGALQDDATSVKWYRMAADQGDPHAQTNLGMMYERARGVPKDYVQAAALYRKGADQGYALAQFNLGMMYEMGRGVPRDFIQARMWLNLAAVGSRDHSVIKARDALASMMTPDQIAQAQALAASWKATTGQ